MFVAISTGPSTHLDHLAPLCALFKIPLYVTDPDQLALGNHFYPMIEIAYKPLETLTLEHIAKNYDRILTCGKFWALELKPLLREFFSKELQFVFAPHGMSDKEALLDKPVVQDLALTYQEMGNIRYWFYKKHKTHFDRLAKPYTCSDRQTILYAPTWETTATGTSFFSETGNILSNLSKDYHLLIKLHPLLEENDPVTFHRILGKYDQMATFIEDFPPVYPLLEMTDIYLGDYSSVGYDFLVYDRPMFFLKEGGRLLSAGKPFMGTVDDQQKELSKERKKLNLEIFGVRDPEKSVAQLVPGHKSDYSSASLAESSASSSRTTAKDSSASS